MRDRRWWIAAALGIVALIADADVPGGVAVIALPDDAYGAWFDGRPVMVIPGDVPIAVVGIPLSARPGALRIVVDADSGTFEQPFDVGHKDYPEQHITIKDQRMVTPAPVDLDRINREAAQMREEYGRFGPLAASPFPLIRPVEGTVSSEFGLKRFFNGEPRRPHSGLDIAAPEGTPVIAPAAGTVTLTGDFYFNGNTVFIDHGGGLITMGCHMSSIEVEKGVQIGRGQLIGRVGSTGRATGPHLHWSLYMNGERIDPRVALALFTDG